MSDPITCEWMQDRIEAYLDDAMSDQDAGSFDQHIDTCPACARELTLAKRIQVSLKEMPMPDVPVTVSAGVFEQIEQERRDARRRTWQSWLDGLRMPVWRPIAAALVLVAVVMIGSRMWQTDDLPGIASDTEAITAEELALAESQAKWALAYISDVSRRTGETVRDDIIGDRVVGTLQRSVGVGN